MQIIDGELLELGVSNTKDVWRTYTYLKIAGTVLKNVRIRTKLDLVLRGQFDKGPIKLFVIRWMRGDTICAITQPDGQTFRQNLQMETGLVVAALVPVFLVWNESSFFGMVAAVVMGLVALPFLKLISKVRRIKSDYVY